MPNIFPIILNSTHAVSGDPSTYIYKFPRGSINLRNASVAINNINLYYSWANISASLYQNNTFKLIVPDASVPTFTEYDVVIPDGNYTIEQLNSFLQSWFIEHHMYHITSSGNRYYMELKSNPITYQIQLISYDLPTSLPSGCSEPSGATFSYPVQAGQQMSMSVTSGFAKLIGFKDGVYMDHSSDITPQMSPVSSVLVHCSLVNNRFTNPNDVIFAFTNTSSSYGNMLSIQNSNLIFSGIDDGIYTHVTIKFTDQENNKLNIKDTNLVIYLIVQIA